MIKKVALILFAALFSVASAQEFAFTRYFHNQTMRVDYFHTGDAYGEEITIDKMYIHNKWAGNPRNCIQPFELGMYRVCLYDKATSALIYTRGFNSIFAEYQTTGPAINKIKKTFHESVILPLPRNEFRLVIEKRDRYMQLSTLFEQVIDPSDYHIIRQKAGLASDVIVTAVDNGDPHHKVDLVILGEGYTAKELHKFKIDLEYFSNLLFTVEPYKSHSGDFNIHGILSASDESGTDEPRQQIYKNTRFSSTFNYFDLDRYCLADDNKAIRDVAGAVPYDAILIMVNRDRYGGGGIFNWQTVFTSNNDYRDYVFLHEFGHGFAGLADEYFSSPVTYTDVFTPGVEPLEANLTSLPDKENVKWKHFLSPGIDIPTDWDKEKYDSLENVKMKIYAEGEIELSKLRKSQASAKDIEETINAIKLRIDEVSAEITAFYQNHPLKDKVGVFEGANYVARGLYRPTLQSLMHGFDEAPDYKTVNEEWIRTVILYYTGSERE